MRLLHTGDWHIGKRLGRYNRLEDAEAVLDEIVDIARAEDVDLVLVAGDLFDHPRPPMEALRLVLSTLHRLSEQAPVVAVAGNHDSPELFDLLADYLREHRIYLVGSQKEPAQGGVLQFDDLKGGQTVLVSCLPFVRESQVVDFLRQADRWHGQYSERMAELCACHDAHLHQIGTELDAKLEARPCIKLVVGHFLVGGVTLGGGTPGFIGAPRGERSLHLGDHYAADGATLPAGAHYIAMGHIHRPQRVPQTAMPAEYCGSPLELDFGEAGEEKRVVVVDIEPGDGDSGPETVVRSVPLTAGRRLRRVRGHWPELVAQTNLQDAYLDLSVRTDGPDPSLADRARRQFPHLVKVRADYERDAPNAPVRTEQPLDQQFAAYYRRQHGREPSKDLLAALREVMQESVDASA